MSLQVIEYGRLLFLVTSGTRRGVLHLVDFEPLDDDGNPVERWIPRCSCEAYAFHTSRPCKHIRAAADYLFPILQHRARWKPAEPPEPPKRTYTLRPRESRKSDETSPARRLPASLHCKPPRIPH